MDRGRQGGKRLRQGVLHSGQSEHPGPAPSDYWGRTVGGLFPGRDLSPGDGKPLPGRGPGDTGCRGRLDVHCGASPGDPGPAGAVPLLCGGRGGGVLYRQSQRDRGSGERRACPQQHGHRGFDGGHGHRGPVGRLPPGGGVPSKRGIPALPRPLRWQRGQRRPAKLYRLLL